MLIWHLKAIKYHNKKGQKGTHLHLGFCKVKEFVPRFMSRQLMRGYAHHFKKWQAGGGV
jgi:hypothetical protein